MVLGEQHESTNCMGGAEQHKRHYTKLCCRIYHGLDNDMEQRDRAR